MLVDYLNNKVRVVIYARVSTEHEAQINALQNQIQYYDNILNQHPNWELVERYIDKGITGTSMSKRPAFMRMMEDASDCKYDLIITREVSRFARNTADTLTQVRTLMQKGIGVYFTEDNIWTNSRTDDDWELKLSLMATLAQNESKKISTRVKAGQKISFENGVFYGNGNILGYDRVGKQMIINQEQAKTVKRMFELYLEGKGVRKIQDILEQEGYKTAKGKTKWSASVIARTLKNEFYCGTITYRKQYVPDYLVQKKINNFGDVEKISVQGTHEPIISKEDFAKVQERLNKNSITINKRKYGHQISSDVFCQKLVCSCGHSFNKRRSYITKDGTTLFLYQCYKQLREGTVNTRLKRGLSIKDSCDAVTISGWELDVTADWIFRKFFDNKQLIFDKLSDMLNDSIGKTDDVEELDEKIENAENELTQIKNKLMTLIDLYTEGNIPKEMYLIKKEETEKRTNEQKGIIEELKKQKKKVDDEHNTDIRKKNIADFLAVNPFKYDREIPEELIKYFVDKIVVHGTGMDWYLKLPYNDNGDKMIPIYSANKNKNMSVATINSHELCTTQHRQLSAKHVNNSKTPQFIVNMGTFMISYDYIRESKKYYKSIKRVRKPDGYEVRIFLITN